MLNINTRLPGKKMKIALSHLSLNFLGGEEKLCLSFIEALKLGGHKVTLFTVEKTDWNSIRKFFGNISMPDEEKYATSLAIHTRFSETPTLAFAYAKYLEGLTKLSYKRKYDLVINTYGDLINSIADLAYVHFPIRATLNYSQTPAFISPFKWKIYCKVYNLTTSILDNIKPSILLTNSKFTQQVVREYLGREALVLHPPVDVQTYSNKRAKQKNYVITVAKFTPKRGLHRVPLIAKNTRNAKFVIVGAADEYSVETIQNLQKIIKKCGVEDAVTLLFNVSRSRLLELLTRAKAYLHVMPFEHFGTSIVEAMASGCIPIVHRSGGPWLDLLNQQQGQYGFSYTTLEEAAQLVDHIMVDQQVSSGISLAAQKRSRNYDKKVFQKKLIAILKTNFQRR